jgi:hypothetical protein
MNLSFEVGEAERYLIDFSFDQIWLGFLRINVNGQPRLRTCHLIGLDPVRTYRLEVGEKQKYAIRIEKEKKPVFGGLLPQRYRVFVDDRLILSVKGY